MIAYTDSNSQLSGLGIALVLVPLALVIFLVWAAVHARRKENKIIAGPHPEDAYVQIGNIRVRKSTLRMGAAAYILGHDVVPHDVIHHTPTDPHQSDHIYGLHHDNEGNQV